jgi:hypothetical protein
VTRRAIAVLALAFALAHVPFLAPSLEDIDSVNFALGIRDFDVANHRPHPPGYPAYIGLGKVAVAVARLVNGDAPQSTVEAQGLSALSLVGAVLAIVLLFGTLRSIAGSDVRALAATALAASSPLFWYLAVRPMSDVPGLAAAYGALLCLSLAWFRQQPASDGDRRLTAERMEASGRMIVLGALLAGLAIGFRSQNAVLTLPFLAGVLLDRVGRGAAGAILGGTLALGIGALVWAVPLVVASGGINAYLAALGTQAGEDFAGVEMLYLNPGNIRLALFALLRTLIYPWDSLVLGTIITAVAVLGTAVLLVRERRALTALVLIAAPYFAFHLLFHDTSFVRYALPLVPVIALLTVVGLELIARQAALPIAGALALWGVSVGAPALSAYASEPSPTVRALAAMEQASAATPPGTIAMHQTFRRPLEAEDMHLAPVLPSPPRREWLELAKYWREGHTEPVWFLADPARSDLALIDPHSRADRTDFTWKWQSLSQLGGMRPRAVQWYRMAPPGWFAEEGWALTPETAGMARLMGRGPSLGPITAWLRRRPEALHAIVGGRHLGAATDPPATFVMSIDGKDVTQWEARPGFFLRDFELPAGTVAGDGLAPLAIRVLSGEGGSRETAIEQFDLQSAGALMWGYDEGWHEAEFTTAFGVFRWASNASTLRIVNATAPLVVTFTIESPRRYFDAPSQVRLMAGERVLGETTIADDAVWRVIVPREAVESTNGRLRLETNQTFVPADTSDVPDQRRLGLRVFSVTVSFEH